MSTLGGLSKDDFRDREAELATLKGIASGKAGARARNVLLLGGRGIGKTELLRQLYSDLFWADADKNSPVPIYYRMRRPSLMARRFSIEYVTSLVLQYIAHHKRDPAVAQNTMTVEGLITFSESALPGFLAELCESIEALLDEASPVAQVTAALGAARQIAAFGGRGLVILLDDFHLAGEIYEREPGDIIGSEGLFGEAMGDGASSYILTGSPVGAMERIFSDDSLLGTTERMALGPLGIEAAFALISERLSANDITTGEEIKGLMRHLGGNPMYINNLALELVRSGVGAATRDAFCGAYAAALCGAETGAYFESVLMSHIRREYLRRPALEVLKQSLKRTLGPREIRRLAKTLGLESNEMDGLIAALEASGLGADSGRDSVVADFISAAHMVEVQGLRNTAARERIIKDRFGEVLREGGGETSFEVTVPMAPEAELVAARAAGEVGLRAGLSDDEIKPLQAALIEALINAFEHSGSYERKATVSLTISGDRLVMAVSSDGKPMDPEKVRRALSEVAPRPEKHRGRGLVMMRKFLDELRVETHEGRTRVIMVKHLKQKGVKG